MDIKECRWLDRLDTLLAAPSMVGLHAGRLLPSNGRLDVFICRPYLGCESLQSGHRTSVALVVSSFHACVHHTRDSVTAARKARNISTEESLCKCQLPGGGKRPADGFLVTT